MSDNLEPMDWQLYFSTLSDECLENIADHLARERAKRRQTNSYEVPPLTNWSDNYGDFPALTQEEQDLVRNGEKIEAIKRFRRRTQHGLYESKKAVDCYIDFLETKR